MKRIGIIMNGVTGRMGTNQHLIRSILAIREQGGVKLPDGTAVMPDPILVGRNRAKLETLAKAHGLERWTTDLDEALANPADTLYFDAQTTSLRAAAVRQAIAAGKHIYCEKPVAHDFQTSLSLAKEAQAAGVKHGVVQDKLWLPGLVKLRRLVESGFFGKILSVRIDFGYWVFEGDWQTAQRPSWNYRKEDGGGIIVDMFPHWQYVIADLFGEITSVLCLGATHIEERVDEVGSRYKATADDAAYALFELENGIIVQANSSWVTRVDRDDLVTFHVDGTEGSAVAGLRKCKAQHRTQTPKAVWNPDIDNPHDYRADWLPVPDNQQFDNAFKIQWELFLRHVVADTPFPWDFYAGAKGVQLAELALQSWAERRWIDVPAMDRGA